jgi:hypothetical protein
VGFVQRNWNVGNLLVLALCAVLGVTLWVPYGTAARTARVEGTGLRLARELLRVATAAPFALDGDGAALLDRMADGRQLEVVPPSGAAGAASRPRLLFASKHYYFCIHESPDDWAAPAGPERARPIEVYAWPRSFFGPARSAFFLPSDAPAAYTRNLQLGYVGLEVIPVAGSARPVVAPEEPEDSWRGWRGRDDGRWLPLPAGEGPSR